MPNWIVVILTAIAVSIFVNLYLGWNVRRKTFSEWWQGMWEHERKFRAGGATFYDYHPGRKAQCNMCRESGLPLKLWTNIISSRGITRIFSCVALGAGLVITIGTVLAVMNG